MTLRYWLATLALVGAVSPARADQVGIASRYGHESGSRTANGERFPTGEATAAHRSLPFGTHVRVTVLASGRACIVRINDRGPFIAGRIIDLSPAAARACGVTGLARVRITVIHR